MDGLFFYLAVTESDRQSRHGLNGTGPYGPVEAPGRLERLRNRLQRATTTRQSPSAITVTTATGEEPGHAGLRGSAPAASQ
jgi:hypothetical protein